MSVRMAPGAALGTLLASGLLTIGAVVLTAAPAHAHNTLQRTSPAADSAVGVAPAKVDLVFDQPVLGIGSGVRVTGPDGDVQVGSPSVVDDTVTQQVRAGAPAGDYTVTWRVTSSDGHPITGSFAFSASKASAAAATTASSPTPAPSGAAAPAAEDEKSPGEDTSWTKILLGGLAGTAAGTAYVLVRRARTRKLQAGDA